MDFFLSNLCIRKVFDFRVKPLYYILAFLLPIVIHAIAHYLAPVMGLEYLYRLRLDF
jgi:hypothetical protein